MSLDRPPVNGETTHQGIDGMVGIGFGGRREAGVSAGGQDVGMAQDLLHLLKADARLNQMSGITVPQAMGTDLFFRPQLAATFFIAT